MSTPIEKAHAYLAAREADRRAALALSEEKAQEARLIKAHQEGFQAAMEMLGMASFACDAAPPPKEPGQGRVRRNIRDLILRELSFSGQPMTAAQIARAIDYHPERTEAALQRMEETGQLLRSAEGRWAVGTSPIDKLNGHAVAGGNGISAPMPGTGNMRSRIGPSITSSRPVASRTARIRPGL